MSLLNGFKKLLGEAGQVAQGVERQLNPFDGGATYNNPQPQQRSRGIIGDPISPRLQEQMQRVQQMKPIPQLQRLPYIGQDGQEMQPFQTPEFTMPMMPRTNDNQSQLDLYTRNNINTGIGGIISGIAPNGAVSRDMGWSDGQMHNPYGGNQFPVDAYLTNQAKKAIGRNIRDF